MKIAAIHHARFVVPDLDRLEAFARDFGLRTVERDADRLVMSTSGGDAFSYVAERGPLPRFVGLALSVDGEADLAMAARLPDASAIHDLDTPGGGRGVTLTDPDGFKIALVHGIAGEARAIETPDLRHNSPRDRVRHGENQHRRALGPATLFRLGHVGLFVSDFGTSAAWYRDTLGMIGSDIYHVPGQPDHKVVGFMRLDRGEEWVDHHTIALMQRDVADCHHISFEAQDFEAQFVAHRFLAKQGHESIWGVGRHPHGSHVFDVWRDPGGWRFETFSDTDLLVASSGTRIHDIRDVEMDVWSSEPPDRYFA